NVLGYQTTGIYDSQETYMIGTTPWYANLAPPHPAELPRGGTPNFLAVLKAAFPDTTTAWRFVTADADLTKGSLQVHSYDVQGTPTRVGIDTPVPIGFDVQYVPADTGDPRV